MSGRIPRTYGRKKTSGPPISQFDRLISETSNKGAHHPVAAKTAGHVGKWGKTSFTSLRSINGTIGKDENLKRTSPSEESDPFGFDAGGKSHPPVNRPIKRPKFFKSRDREARVANPNNQSHLSYGSSSLSNTPESTCNTFFKSASTKTLNDNSLSGNKNSVLKPSNSGIKLKIFKSRNTGTDLHSPETYSSSIQLPSDESSRSSCSSNGTSDDHSDILSCKTEEEPSEEIVQLKSGTSDKDNLQCTIDSSYDSGTQLKCSLDTNVTTKSDSGDSLIDNCPSPLTEDVSSKKYSCQSPVAKKKSCTKYNCPSPIAKEKSSTNYSCLSLISEDKSFQKHSCPSKVSEEKNLEPIRELLSVKSDKNSGCDSVDSDNVGFNLFGTDFDENEIIDRTCIDYPNAENNSCSDNRNHRNNTKVSDVVSVPASDEDRLSPLSRANTLDISGTRSYSDKSPAKSIPKTFSESDADAVTFSRKRSIFKSRQKDGEPKKRATYTHKWHGHEEKKETGGPSTTHHLSASAETFDFDSHLTKVPTKAPPTFSFDEEENLSSSIKCPKEAKKFYTVIQNVKKTHQLQESGEFQEFNDDVEYFLDALRSSNKIATRCLASLNLAQKSMTPAFRMHLRAHATVTKFFWALLDAPNDPNLAQCAAMVMFALSQDRLNMELDRKSLELMLNLLDTNSTSMDILASSKDGEEQLTKIQNLCKELQLQGHAKHLKLNKINASNLAMETLLSLTSKRAGEWFKEELRQLGGIDHLVKTVLSNASAIKPDMLSWTSSHIDKLSRIDRCLKVLENVTHQNISNQDYLFKLESENFGKTLMRLFWVCHQQMTLNPEMNSTQNDLPVSKNLVATLITTMKVLINLTHGSKQEALGSQILGNDEEIYSLTLSCLLKMPRYLNHDSKFEIQVLSCCLLLNLVEKSQKNREKLMRINCPIEDVEDDDHLLFVESETKVRSSMQLLINLFYTSEESARVQEAHTDNIIDKDLDQNSKEEKDEDIEDTVARLLQKAGRHMEDTLIAAYTALIAGYCLIDNKKFEKEIRRMQPEGHFKTMVSVMKKFLHFMNLTATTSLLRSLKPTEQVVTYMENLDKEPEKPKKKEEEDESSPSAFDDAFGF